MDLRTFTAVDRLRVRMLHAVDQLPPSLTALNALDCFSLQPLSALQQLQTLEIEHSTTPAAALGELPSLACPALTSMCLCYETGSAAGAAAAAWRDLVPFLTSLTMEDYSDEPELVPGSLVQGLHNVTSLVTLSLAYCCDCEASAGELASA